MKKTIFKWVLLLILMAYTAFMTVWAHDMAKRDVCRGYVIKVDGASSMESVVKTGLEKELKAYPVRIAGTPIGKRNASEIEMYLDGSNMFENVSCMLTSDNKLLVEAEPLVPVMRVFTG